MDDDPDQSGDPEDRLLEEQRSEEPGPADDGPAWMDAPVTEEGEQSGDEPR